MTNTHIVAVPTLPTRVVAVEAVTVQRVVDLVQQAVAVAAPATAEQAEQARAVLVQIQKTKNQIEKERKAVQEPFKRVTDQILEIAKAVAGPLEQAQTVLKAGLEAYLRDVAEANAARQAEISRAQTAPVPEGRATPALPVMAPPVREAEVSTYQHTDIQIDSPDLVPRQFCDPSLAKLREAVRMGATEIPGVTIVRVTRVASR